MLGKNKKNISVDISVDRVREEAKKKNINVRYEK